MQDEVHALAVGVIHLFESRDVYAEAKFATIPAGGRVL
jgi:hypothetical protein